MYFECPATLRESLTLEPGLPCSDAVTYDGPFPDLVPRMKHGSSRSSRAGSGASGAKLVTPPMALKLIYDNTPIILFTARLSDAPLFVLLCSPLQ